MFQEATKQLLIDAIGWKQPISAGLVISEENLRSDTGRVFSAFHPLVTVENVNDTAGDDAITISQLNSELYGFKKQAASKTLSQIFSNSPQYDPFRDYGGEVVKYLDVIVEAYGFNVAAMTMQMMLTSKRVNDTERKTKYGFIKTELEGIKDEYGRTVSRGILSRLTGAVIDAQKIIFPQSIEIYGDPEW